MAWFMTWVIHIRKCVLLFNDFYTNMMICCFNSKAIVPEGICITTIAMRAHINENKELSNYLNNAIEKAKQNDFEQLSNYCER